MMLVVAEDEESNLPVDHFENKMIGKRIQGSAPQTAGDEMKALGIPDDLQSGLLRLRKEAISQLGPSFFIVEHQR